MQNIQFLALAAYCAIGVGASELIGPSVLNVPPAMVEYPANSNLFAEVREGPIFEPPPDPPEAPEPPPDRRGEPIPGPLLTELMGQETYDVLNLLLRDDLQIRGYALLMPPPDHPEARLASIEPIAPREEVRPKPPPPPDRPPREDGTREEPPPDRPDTDIDRSMEAPPDRPGHEPEKDSDK